MLIANDWLMIIVYFVVLLLLVVLSDILNKKFNVKGKITRRFVHIGVGLIVCTTPFTLKGWLPPAVLATIFLLANLLAIKMGLMKGIHSTKRISYGTVFFPMSYLILILLFWKNHPEILIVSMLLLSITDPLAAIIGERYGERFNTYLYDKKSYRGLYSVFISSFILSFLTLILFNNRGIYIDLSSIDILLTSLAISFVAVPAEAVSIKGTDNLSLPLLTGVMLSIMLNTNSSGRINNILWILLTFFVVAIAYKGSSLSKSGMAGATVVGAFIFTIGGVAWLVPLGVFFVLASVLSKIGKKRKQELKNIVLKGGRRDISQVYANGGIGLLLVLIYHFIPDTKIYIMFLASFAAANADTWGTEIGTYFKKTTRSIINFKKVPPGTSGGVSSAGSIGGVAGAALVALSGIYFLPPQSDRLAIFGVVTISGLLGALIDSYVGGLFQAEYTCPECKIKTERLIHCDINTEMTAGIKWINNDMVNFICTLSGAVIAFILYLFVT